MKIVQINTFPNKSTGNIMMNIHKKLIENNIESYVVWGRGKKAKDNTEIYMNDKLGVYLHGLYTRITDKAGFASKRATKKLLQKLDVIRPDIIHLHNLHGYYINIEMLFNYIKRNNIKVVWTLHDCWAFTGHCAYFDMVNCEKWKSECRNCELKNTYPKTSIIDNSSSNYYNKKKLFNNVEDMQIISVSKWLENKIKSSFLEKHKILTIQNGIDINVFKPTESVIRETYNLQGKKVILGVASEWTKRKGLEDFIKLSQIITDEYQIILIGLNKKQIKQVPNNIIALERMKSIEELVEYYSIADVYFNASVEETFGMTTIEAMACKTPVIVYNATALPEVVTEDTGFVIEPHNIEKVWKKIELICENKIFNKKNIRKNAEKYNKEEVFEKYINVYKSMI